MTIEPTSSDAGHVIHRRDMLFGILGTSYLQFVPAWLSNLSLNQSAEARLREVKGRLKADERPSTGESDDSSMLMADATLAWTYFENFQAAAKPIIPGTGYWDNNKIVGYPVITMWDVASIINAGTCARILGLISSRTHEKMSLRTLDFLKNATFGFSGARLPQLQVSVQNEFIKTNGFDSADVGRLLISLKILDNVTNRKLGIAELVKQWDFTTILRDGRVCNANGRRLKPYPPNSYTSYITEGYRLWGYELGDPLQQLVPALNDDNTAENLVAYTKMSRIATETSTTQLMELGHDRQARLLCDVLLAAMIKRHEDTGFMTCVSEGIVDQRPWFTYQACQIDVENGDQWVVDGKNDEDVAFIKPRADDLRLVSTKGCYLWHAVSPGRYADSLLEFARNRSKIPGLGFASGVYEKTLKPTYCSDINTNALILEAITFVLRGRVPLIDQSQLDAR